jgi:hypothetical protein
MRTNNYSDNVFINCPFDDEYSKMFNSLLFATTHCGFYVRCALEENDCSMNRLSKIMDIMAECKYSIHDISRTQINTDSSLPRFNMPLELGIFLGAKRFGNMKQKNKQCLILDSDKYRYQQFVSDISGQDIEAHNNEVKTAINCVRNWLANKSHDRQLCSGSIIYNDYLKFKKKLPYFCLEFQLNIKELTFCDTNFLVNKWCHDSNTLIQDKIQ